MSNYTALTENELFHRFSSLSADLQEALASEKVLFITRGSAKNHHVTDEEQVLIIQQLTGLVLFGYVHAIDLGREIAQATGLNPKLAADIADEISKKIFSPIKDELERNYEPLLEEESSPLGPIMLSDVVEKKIAPPLQPEPPRMPPASLGGGMSLPSLRESLGQAPRQPFTPSPPRQSVPTPPPAQPPTPHGDGPVMLHQESEFHPTQTAGNFQLEIPFQEIREPKSGFEEPRRPARLEIGTPPTAPSASHTENASPRVVHYGPQDVNVRVSETSIPDVPSVSRVPSPPKPQGMTAGPNDININIFNVKKAENGATSTPGLGIPSAMKPVSSGTASPYPQPSSMPIGGGMRSFGSPMGGSVGNTGALPSVGPAAHVVGAPAKPMASFGPPPQTKKRGFFAWLASLFTRTPKKEVVFAPKIVTASATMKTTPPRPPVPPKAPTPPPSAPTLQPSSLNPQPTSRRPSLTGEVVDLSTLTREELKNGEQTH